MQKSVSKVVRKPTQKYTQGIKLTLEENEMLRDLAEREDRKKTDEVVFLIKRRLRELDGYTGGIRQT